MGDRCLFELVIHEHDALAFAETRCECSLDDDVLSELGRQAIELERGRSRVLRLRRGVDYECVRERFGQRYDVGHAQ